MSIFNKKGKAVNPMADFEKAFVNKKEKTNPVVKAGSIVLYVTLIVTVIACVFMAVLDKTGVAPSPLPQKDKTADKARTVDVSSHPESLQRLYMENFETADFVASYFEEKDKQREVTLKKYKRSREVPLFIQWDKQWGYLQYGEDIAGVNGDGPMCLAMAGYHLTKEESFSPDKMLTFAQENGFYKKGEGTVSALMKEGAVKLGLISTELKATQENITTALNEGKVIICLMEKGKLSASVHYVVLRGCKDGKLFINDPTSIVNSEKEWSFEDILPEIKNAWAVSK